MVMLLNKKLRKLGKRIIEKITPKRYPSFLIIGAQKSGTSALHYYLNQHPKLKGSKPKEIHYFNLC